MKIVDEHITAYINSLELELPQYLSTLEKEALENAVPIIRKEAQAVLKFFLDMKQPHQILEVGTAVGFSCSMLSEYMPEDCHITTIEKVPMRIVEAKKNLAKARRASDISLVMGDAIDALKVLNRMDTSKDVSLFNPSGNKKELCELADCYDFIFMDAAKGQYMNFLPEIMRLLPVGGLFITDNVLQEGSIAKSKYSITRRDRTIHTRMREYLYELTHRDDLTTMILPVGDGMAVSTRIQ